MAQTQKSLHQLAANTAEKLPEVSLSEPFGDGCLVHKVVDKVFMLSLYLNGHAIINLKVQPEHGAMLRDFYPYIRAGWHMNKQHWISIFADENLDEQLVQDLVLNSYELVVAKLKKVERQRIELLRSAT
ncbi:MmcQ/YjbR family DNA-binding protein [Acinetobacter sp. SCLZS86]|uniref:MmcQ/YjbR family DNA-binding protein n=1 Tax=Acinetobacter sp. SCLZS86 TaxID=2908637 RepID=UPI001F4752B7|nr:MmcQ/YjbR family DNA-binding protein [Acinetobacter sp. SCLZS86]UIZ57095.1 MmcQ/YjbR family DNA-binding protein [Acinetobacter sp. SCLZS86]